MLAQQVGLGVVRRKAEELCRGEQGYCRAAEAGHCMYAAVLLATEAS